MWSTYAPTNGAIKYEDTQSIAFRPDGARLVVALNDPSVAGTLAFVLLDTADGTKQSTIQSTGAAMFDVYP
jgi:hypothetical protein